MPNKTAPRAQSNRALQRERELEEQEDILDAVQGAQELMKQEGHGPRMWHPETDRPNLLSDFWIE